MSVSRQNFIGGAGRDGSSGRMIKVFNPATEDETCRVPDSSWQDVNTTVKVAEQALVDWRDVPPISRCRILMRFRELLEKNRSEISGWISKEHGKTREDASAELSRAIDVLEFSCGIPQLLKGEHSHHAARDIDCWSMMLPVGVCAGITPFNFPAMVPLWMVSIALACGNTFILKPSEKDPSAPAIFPELLKEAGLPDGVFNVVHGSAESVNAILDHPGIGAVSFVGSTPVAKHVYERGSAAGKRVQALGGAKNHAVVLPDADMDMVADQLAGAAYGSAGERCMAISVVVAVGDEVGDQLAERLSEHARSLKVGAFDTQPDLGPLITMEHREKVLGLVDSGVKEGARLLVDGREASFERGSFLAPCLFDYVEQDMAIYQQEIFGPVLCIVRVSNYQQALDLIASNQYGNGSAIFTGSGKLARHFCEHADTGMVGVNVPIPVPVAWHCFGGIKQSLFGPLHMHGPDGVRFFTRMRTVTARWPENLIGQRDANLNIPEVK
ncbi:CoA-acylating methylmalonate-semialdehyde dehydrogenase [Endozoicomonas arenosclerae]|uniref:CoA-acylating methylmalonate-semialdehyde dehydrogenase n=1 Tax=Endozoicomonas arenosclerae TaxID=1633495 RepID=UPI000784C57B|nr:CoA-acylating methylmalonate-semialdehyde dehydrogenase [Endozoicomonas arenosclerae]